jgi:hypothetical protein
LRTEKQAIATMVDRIARRIRSVGGGTGVIGSPRSRCF